MNKFVFTIGVFILIWPLFAKAESFNSFYLGGGLTGVNKMKEIPKFFQEIKGTDYISQKSSERKNRRDNELFLGYKINPSYAIELSYNGENRSTLYTSSGVAIYDNDTTSKNYLPYKATLENRFSALHFSVIGEKEISDYFSIFGRVGLINSNTKWERKVNFDTKTSFSDNLLKQKWSNSSTKISSLFGFGLSTQLSNHIYMRTEAVKSLGLGGIIPKIAIIYSF